MELPRVTRKYEHQDFSYLLQDLQENSFNKDKKPEEEYIEKNLSSPAGEVVSIARRRRSSKMDNHSMGYAYSTSKMIIHDRDCKLVKSIPDDEFEMLKEFDPDMKTCKRCYRNALIRSGIGDDRKRLRAYGLFFKDIGASNCDLYRLIIEHQATLEWQDRNTMKIHVNEDSWKVIHNEQGNSLYHNNYIYLDDYTRIFKEEYHEQMMYGPQTFHNMVNIMVQYSWEDHVDKIKAEKEQTEILNPKAVNEADEFIMDNTSNKPKDARDIRVTNYYQLKKFSFFYHSFVFLDTKEYMADQIFINHKIKVHFGRELENPNSDYIAVFIKVKKKETEEFLRSMEELENKMLLKGHKDYPDFCNRFMKSLG